MNYKSRGVVYSVNKVKDNDLWEILVQNSDGTFANFLVDEDGSDNIIESFEDLPITKLSQIEGCEVLGDWHMPKEGEKQLINERHPLTTVGNTTDRDLTIERGGKATVLKVGEKAKVGDFYVYPKVEDELRQRYRHNIPPKYKVTDSQTNRIISSIKAKQALASLGITTGGIPTTAPSNVGSTNFTDAVNSELS